ncbi:MAG: FtsW/RodA/SpoVE family cell cycle protein [Bacteroidetes bacterium]|nr:FtsW/RodA/SpoVE family cell cycle protein [Bacteroidota bacterium]MBU1718270.1 FtsW/RodA/SpoVE family cell cycle protein [Bacteroidota bacterium]
MENQVQNKKPFTPFAFVKGDKVIWSVVMVLLIFSVLAVYSSTGTLAYKYKGGNTEYYLIKHLFILVFAVALMYLAHLVDYRYYAKFSKLLIYLAIPLLLMTLVIGTSLNDAARWITLPIINLSFQTSDFAKLALIMYVARTINRRQASIKSFRDGFLPLIVPVMVVCILILPANFSTAALLFLASYIMMFIGGVSVKHLLTFGVGILAVVVIFGAIIYYNPDITKRSATWKSRIDSFISGDEESNYQAEQSKIAIAKGGIFGKGPGNSTQRNFLPHPYSDFIFAIIIEEYGLIGGIFFILLYLILLLRGIRIAGKSQKLFPALMVTGLSFSLVIQSLINMAVATNLLPVTGQPLLLVSMGGTSLWFTSISIGIILSVSRYIESEGKTGNTEYAEA